MESLVLIILITLPGVWSGDWGVTLENQCALRGTSVVLKCDYDYPSGHTVTSVSWSKAQYVSNSWRLVALSQLFSPLKFNYVGNKQGDCDLRINNVRFTDEGHYHFSFETRRDRWSSKTFSYLFVRGLTAVVWPNTVTEGEDVRLICHSGCPQTTEFVWFRDGQPVSASEFQATSEDAGKYHCAVKGQETAKSASVALNVRYSPKKVTLSVSPSADIIKGDTLTFSCSSDANPPVAETGYSLFKDGQFVSSGQEHTISEVQLGHSGRYHCQAWNNITWRGSNLFNSTEVLLDVHYHPTNTSVSVVPERALEGSSVNLTCSSDANPPVDSYTWYKMAASSSSMTQVGSGQTLFLPSMQASHTGLYLCLVRNSVGENNSTEVLLSMAEKQQGSPSIPVLVGIGVSLCITLVIVLLLLRRKRRRNTGEKPVFDSVLSRSQSSATEDPSDAVYANILTSTTSAPLAISSASPRNSHSHGSTSYEDEVLYSTVTIKPKNTKPVTDSSRAAQDSWSTSGENSDSVIYAAVVTTR
ncbi:B-cell receptor CD22-like isoform X2 [Acanthochromis polyacanthus]|uniref:B-cell receptor CD22-like isoform X2 n=1 Tax=Acanthochromis polyacanthus TaxID=80966 RepID=UPI002234CE1D|nr:B-cell receptor CD22-like isoform X2 [Acanthochromis polyacanthus]